MLNKDRDILTALTQGRQRYHHDIQPIVKVLAEGSLVNGALKIARRRRHEPDVYGYRRITAEPVNRALLQRAQQLRLERGRQLADLILEAEGFRVLAAEDGTQALSLLLSEEPEAALLDIRMPGLDGLAVLRCAREGGSRQRAYRDDSAWRCSLRTS